MNTPSQPRSIDSTKHTLFIRRDWLTVSILTIIVVIIWIAISVYHALYTVEVPEPLRRRVQQFSPQLNEEVLKELSTRKPLVDQQLDEQQRVILLGKEEGGNQQPQVAPTSASTSPREGPTVTPTRSPTQTPTATVTP